MLDPNEKYRTRRFISETRVGWGGLGGGVFVSLVLYHTVLNVSTNKSPNFRLEFFLLSTVPVAVPSILSTCYIIVYYYRNTSEAFFFFKKKKELMSVSPSVLRSLGSTWHYHARHIILVQLRTPHSQIPLWI